MRENQRKGTAKKAAPDLSHLKEEYEVGLNEFRAHADILLAIEAARVEVRGLVIEKLARQGIDIKPILRKCDSQMAKILKNTEGRVSK